MTRKVGRPRRLRDRRTVSINFEDGALLALDRLLETVYPLKTRNDLVRLAVDKWLMDVDVEFVEHQIRENLAMRDALYKLKETIAASGLRVSEELAHAIAARKTVIQTQLSQGLRPGDNRVWLRNKGVPEADIEKFVELLKP